jgi:hypothetical protein
MALWQFCPTTEKPLKNALNLWYAHEHAHICTRILQCAHEAEIDNTNRNPVCSWDADVDTKIHEPAWSQSFL